jgi:hypothetical protein
LPGPDSIVFGGPPGWVVGAWQWATGRPDSSRIESANIAAARAAGFTGSRDTLAQIGGGIRNVDAFRLGQGGGPGDLNRAGPVRTQLPAVIPPVFSPPSTTVYYPPPPGSGGSGSSGQRPPPPPPPRPGTPPINPNAPPPITVGVSWPWVAASVLGPYVIPGVIEGGRWTRDWINAGRPLPKGPKTRRQRSPHRGPGPGAGRGDPFPPQGPPASADRPRPERIPRGERVASVLGQLGGDIWVNPKRLPVPAMPTPAAAPPPPKPLWQQLLPIVGPALLGFLQPSQGNRTVVRLTDPLTQPVPGGANPFPLTPPQTLVQSFGAFGGTPGAVGTNTCECKAPRKKGRKKKRTVCYSGSYIERRDGTRKTKKRKVQCL